MSSQTTSTIFSCAQQLNTINNKVKVSFGSVCDFVVVAGVDSTKIGAHRDVLSASNDFFEAMFRSNLQEAETNQVEFQDFGGSTLKSIMEFFYSASIDISIETVQNLLEAAGFLQMKTLVTACCDFIEKRIDISNYLAIDLFADYYGHKGLCSASYSFACKYFDEVWINEEFCQLSEEQLNKLLSSDCLVTSSEEKVFQSVLAWVKFDEKNRGELLSKVMCNVRFPFLDPKFIIENRDSLCQSIECCRLMSSWLQWHFSPETRSNYPLEQTKPRKPLLSPQSVFEVFTDSEENEDYIEEFVTDYSPEYDEESLSFDHVSIDSDEPSYDWSYNISEDNDEFLDDNEYCEPDEDEFVDDIDICNEPDEFIENCVYDCHEENDECLDIDDVDCFEENIPDCFDEFFDQSSPQDYYNDYSDQYYE